MREEKIEKYAYRSKIMKIRSCVGFFFWPQERVEDLLMQRLPGGNLVTIVSLPDSKIDWPL